MSRKTNVPLERRFPCWRQIDDVEPAKIGTSIRRLNWRIPDNGVFAHDGCAGSRHHDDALRVASDNVVVKSVSGGGADDANTEVVRRIGKTIARRAIQPDPAVVAGDSNTAAGRGCRPIPNRSNALDQRPESVGGNEHAGPAVR